MKEIRIGLLGCGTVGAGVVKLLMENGDILKNRLGADLKLKYIADIDIETDRGIPIDKSLWTKDASMVTEDPDVDIIVELIGGEGFARDMILKAIRHKKHVVTANKALLAKHGNEIFKEAEKNETDLYYEASVGGCMPIIKTLREAMAGNRISFIGGILNGTCNYILTKITREGATFQNALAEAQQKGIAELDPTLDVEGLDTAHKLAIMSALAFGMQIDFDGIYVEGISKITPLDIEFARQFGYTIKLLAISKFNKDSVEARVHPTMISRDNMLSKVDGTLNAVTVTGDAAENVVLMGHGAGRMPTASAVVGDIVDIARNIVSKNPKRIPLTAFQPDSISPVPIIPIDEIRTRYYFRFSAADRPGVLSTISGILGKYDISIRSVHQKGRKSMGTVPLVMLTHEARETDVKKAFNEIASLDIVDGTPALIRIEDNNGED